MSVDLRDCVVCGVIACEVKHDPTKHCAFTYRVKKLSGGIHSVRCCLPPDNLMHQFHKFTPVPDVFDEEEEM